MNRNELLDTLEDLFPGASGSAISNAATLVEKLLDEQRDEYMERIANANKAGDDERATVLRMEADRDKYKALAEANDVELGREVDSHIQTINSMAAEIATHWIAARDLRNEVAALTRQSLTA